jgi:hypothetical protein
MSLEYLINKINENQDKLNDLFIKCHKIYKQISPSKNENKFPFGILIQMAIIEFLDDIFYKCIDLDEIHTYGSEYKNDCCLYIDELNKINLSIKAKSKEKNDTIIINNYGNEIERDLSDLISIILVIDTNKMFIIPHKEIEEKYIIVNNSNISYKSSLLTFINKNKKELYIELNKNDKFKSFIEIEYDNLKSVNIYKELYQKYSL